MMLANLPDFVGVSLVVTLKALKFCLRSLAVLLREGEVFHHAHAVLHEQAVFHEQKHDSAHDLERDLGVLGERVCLLRWREVGLGEQHVAALHEQHAVEEMSVSNLMFGRLGSSVDESLWGHLWLGGSGASIHLLSQSLIENGHVMVVNEDFQEVRCSLAFAE